MFLQKAIIYTKANNPNEIMLPGNENIKLNVPSSSEQLGKATLILFFLYESTQCYS
jgi:hypothetical protein